MLLQPPEVSQLHCIALLLFCKCQVPRPTASSLLPRKRPTQDALPQAICCRFGIVQLRLSHSSASLFRDSWPACTDLLHQKDSRVESVLRRQRGTNCKKGARFNLRPNLYVETNSD